MSNQLKNVHEYDGKLKNIFQPSGNYTREEKIKCLKDLNKVLHPIAKLTINIMLSEFEKTNTGSNYQPENGLNAVDILVDIITNTEL